MPTAADHPPAVVLGGGIAGLAAARLLTRHFARVVVLERDTRPDTAAPDSAYAAWVRSGVPQFRHSHAFLARLRLVLLAHLPEVLERLRSIGVRELGLAELAPPGVALAPEAGDEEVVLLACRRATFEWALRECVRARPGVELREGTAVAGLSVAARDGGRPSVSGVRLVDGSVIPAALVVDATGRRSRAPTWLAAIGAPPPRERCADTGMYYYTRFYRLRRKRALRGTTGLVAGDLGWVKVAIFPGDNGSFSISVGAPVADASLGGLTDPARFEAFVQAFPAVAPWRARGVSAPIDGPTTPVLVMGKLRNRLRRFVDREGPLVANFMAIGDAAYHSNPVYGRGATSAIVQAALLDEALGRHPGDVRAAACFLDRESERQLRPFWEAAVAGDRWSLGATPSPKMTDPLAWLALIAEQAFGWFFDLGMLPASRVDPVIFRALMRIFNMLELPERLFTDPGLLLRALPVLARVLRGDGPPPLFPVVARETALSQLERAGVRG
ncbi:MAG: FAD-dependent oxidoreductase [Deltaproteobacteria bacterium]|nr:MAG: FAD-dependent oxidoreductase [Deltaproteobacteria bacterium]